MSLSMFGRLGRPAMSEMASRRDVLFWVSLAAVVAVIKIIFLSLDSLPLFYLGDSGVYLSSAISSSLPSDRSFTYGVFFIGPVLAMFGSVAAFVAFQALVSGATALLAGVCLRVGFDAPPWVVAVTAVGYAFEPLALLHERLILTETVALFFLALFALVGLLYIRQPRWHLLILLAPLGTIALSLRTSFVPVILVATVSVVLLGAPRLRQLTTDPRNFLRVLFLHALVAALATVGFHEAYKQYFSYMTNARPSYNAGGGFFLIASWAPLITKADFPNERVANLVLSNVKHDLGSRSARPVHRFWEDGLVGAIVKAEKGNGYLADKLAGKIAKKAARRDPMGVAWLAWQTYGDFWDRRIMTRRLGWEEGERELDDNLIKHFREHHAEDLAGHHLQSTVTKEWHQSTTYWYRFLLLSPFLSLLTIIIAGAYRASSAFIAVLVCALMLVNCALVTEPVFRYLQPVAWLTCLLLGQILSRYAQTLETVGLASASRVSGLSWRAALEGLSSTKILSFAKSPGQRRLVIWLSLIIVYAAGLRFYALDRWSLWLDETVTYLYASTPLSKLHTEVDATHMPVSLELSHALVQLGLDQSVWQLRLPSAILGVATVLVVFLLGKELFCKRIGLFSALVACVMPVLVIYSQEYRPYSLLIFLTVLSGWSLAAALRTNGSGWWCLFVGATILNLYTHFVALSSLAALSVAGLACILLKLKQREPIKPTLTSSVLAFGVIAAAYLPAIARLYRMVQVDTKWGGVGPGWDVFSYVYVQSPGFGEWLNLVAAALAVLGLLWASVRFTRGVLFLVAVLGVSAFLFRNHSHVVFSPRYVSFVMPYFAIAIGTGLGSMAHAIEAAAVRLKPNSQHVGAMATAVLMLLVLIFSASPLSAIYAENPKQLPVDLRRGFDYVRNRIQPGDLLLEASTLKGGSVYWYKAYNSYFLQAKRWPRPLHYGIIDNVNFPKAFARYLGLNGRLWILITIADSEQANIQARAGKEFAVECFRRICAIRSRNPLRPMAEQLNAFFDRFEDLDPKYFGGPARVAAGKIN